MNKKPMDDVQFCAVVSEYIRHCEQWRDDRHEDRLRAIEYYQGTMRDIPEEKGRSRVVSRDLRAAVNKVVPSVMRTVFGGDKVVEFTPNGEGDENVADDVTDYFNEILLPECQAENAGYDAFHDALLMRNGVLHWYIDYKREPKVSLHTGLSEEAFTVLVSDEGVEVLEHTPRMEMQAGAPVPVHDVRIMRIAESKTPVLCAVPLDEFLIHPDALSAETALACGRYRAVLRTDLIAMGYDPERVAALPRRNENSPNDDLEDERRDELDIDRAPHSSADEIDYYEMYVRIDADGDGLAELRRVVMVGGTRPDNLFENEYWDETPFSDVVIERRPHAWEGVSLADDLIEIQRIKTVLTRATLDNLYWQNKPQPIVQADAIEDPDSLINPAFGKPIRVRAGINVADAVQYNRVPFVAADSFNMLAYMDKVVTDRTGVSEASSGLAPDALQNMTAKASAMIEQAGIGRTEQMVRSLAMGLRKAIKGLFKLVIQHADAPTQIRLKGRPLVIDPRQWNAGMDVSINIGLGAGSRERDLMALGMVKQTQAMIATQAPHLGIVTPETIYRVAITEAASAGIKTPENFYKAPEEGATLIPPNQPNPEMIKLQAQMQLEEKKMQAQREKEIAQGQADIAVAQQKALLEQQFAKQEADMKRLEIHSQQAIEFAKIDAQAQLEREKMAVQLLTNPGEEKPEVDQSAEAVRMLAEQIGALVMKKPRSFHVRRDPMTGDMLGIDEADDLEAPVIQ